MTSTSTLYFDCFSGAAGDMLVGALLDAGADFDAVRQALGALNLSGYRVTADKIVKQGFAATQFTVHVDDGQPQPCRRLADIGHILRQADIDPAVRDTSIRVFERLAQAEAMAHGIDVQEVHFHEVGAVDAIVDVVAATAAVRRLNPGRMVCSRIVTGGGTVRCAHGVMPVPAPATVHLLRGVPLEATDHAGELTTPTAAALLVEWCDQFGVFPRMTIDRVGMGAGTRDNPDRCNCVRVLVGTTGEQGYRRDEMVLLEANLDDCPGQWVGHCMARLMDAGARDAFATPIYMKKGRPGVVLSVLCDLTLADVLEGVIFAETTTLGVRRRIVQRTVLPRGVETVETRYGSIRIKRAFAGGVDLSVSAEYDDCVAAAGRFDVPLRVVIREALSVWHQQTMAQTDQPRAVRPPED